MAKLTSADRLVLKEAYERVCPLSELTEAVHRCMNNQPSVWRWLHARVAPWQYCGTPMHLLQDCDREQRRFLADNRDSLSRALLFRDTLEQLSEAKSKGQPTYDLERKLGHLRKEFRMIIDAKKAPPKSPQQQQLSPSQTPSLSKKEKEAKEKREALQEAHANYLQAQSAHMDQYLLQAPTQYGRLAAQLRKRSAPHMLGGAL